MSWLALISFLGALVRAEWVIAGMILTFTKGRHGHPLLSPWVWVWAELRPFYLPAVVFHLGQLVVAGEMGGWNIFFSACELLNWWFFKDVSDDDRWKRRAKKVAEKIERRGARLVAVPVRGGAA